jgi:hypothetical protein
MRRISLGIGLLALAACGPKEQPAADTAAMAAAPTIALADVAGTWSGRVMPEMGDSTVLTYELVASADPSAWTVTFPGRPAIAVRPTVDGDSIMTEMGPYESVLRRGVQVTTNSVYRLVNGELVGTAHGHYQGVTGADSIARFRVVATKKM